MTSLLYKDWPKQDAPYFASPCVIERLRHPGSGHDVGTQFLLVPERNGRYDILRVTFSLLSGDTRLAAPDQYTALSGGFMPKDALREVYSLLGDRLIYAKGRIDAGVQCWPARGLDGFCPLRPLSTFGAAHPDLAAQSQKLASRWGQKSAPFRGHPRMGRPDLDFLFK
jgi:hypothetical protein